MLRCHTCSKNPGLQNCLIKLHLFIKKYSNKVLATNFKNWFILLTDLHA